MGGILELPSGNLECGETIQEGLIREVKEETGYDVIFDSIRPFGEIEEKRLSTFKLLSFCDYYFTFNS